MSFNINRINTGEWFLFQDSEVDPETGIITWFPVEQGSDEKVCFKQIDPERMREIKDKYKGKKINTPMLNTLSKTMELVVTYEQTAEQEKGERMEFWNEAIVDWNITDPAGNKIECSSENKYLLIKGDMRFLRFANRCLQLLSGMKQEDEKKQEKN